MVFLETQVLTTKVLPKDFKIKNCSEKLLKVSMKTPVTKSFLGTLRKLSDQLFSRTAGT